MGSTTDRLYFVGIKLEKNERIFNTIGVWNDGKIGKDKMKGKWSKQGQMFRAKH
jgi:hypothetical protein